eukprot:g13365.t1
MSDPSARDGDVKGERNERRPGFSSVRAQQQQQEGEEHNNASSRNSCRGNVRSRDSVDSGSSSSSCKNSPDDDQISAIQGCGYLVALREDGSVASGMRLVGLSSNITSSQWWNYIGGSPAADVLGNDLAHVFRPEFTETVRTLLQRLKKHPDALSLPQRKTCGELKSPDDHENSGQVLTCSLTPGGCSTGVYLLEAELTTGSGHHHHQTDPGLQHLTRVMWCIPVGFTPQSCAAVLCDALMEAMPAYDRAMVYRFAEDESGEVIHETTQPGSAVSLSYVGLRFRAGDVPPVAHEPSFRRTGVSFIADTRAQAVPVAMSNGGCSGRNTTPFDLSMAMLRAPVERHRRYLRNMGVTANMAAAIVVQDELWGIFTFHGYAGPVVPTMADRVMVEIAAALFAKEITRYELERTARLSRALDQIGSYMRVQDFLVAEHWTLLSILDLDSIVMWEPHKSVLVFGNGEVTLSPEECDSLVATTGDGHNKHISLRSTEARGVAFFSVRSFLLAFLRDSVVSRRGGGGGSASSSHAGGNKKEKPGPGRTPDPTPSWDGGRAGGGTAARWKAWSRHTMSLLGIVRHGLSSQLYAEALSADNVDVLAHVSHELRTPFHGVMSSLEALFEEKHSLGAAEKDSILRSAMDAGKSMLISLDRILDLAKTRNGTELAVDRFLASRPLLQTISAMKQFATKKSLAFTTTVGTTSPSSSPTGGGKVEPLDSLEVTGDERRIKDIIQNLISNAIKFTPGGGKVHTSLLTFDSLGDASEWWRKESCRFDEARWNGPTGVDSMLGANKDGGGGGVAAGDGGRVEVESPPPPRWYVYCVEDNGVGILPSDFGQLMAKYRQISPATSNECSGTGLGLHVSSLHISLMSGSLGIASSFAGAGAVGGGSGEAPARGGAGGTLFAVVLPLCPAAPLPPAVELAEKRAAAAATENRITAAPSSFWGSPASRRLTFLVVDDHKLNIKLLQRKIQLTFEDTDVQVLTAMDGVMALDTLAVVRESRSGEEAGGGGGGASPPIFLAGIFLDFHMPNMSGVECTKRIRQAEAENGWQKVFIGGCTADLTESSRDRFIGAGGDSILLKPWGPGRVERMCHEMLAHAVAEEKKGKNKD